MAIWTLLEGPLMTLVLGGVLALVALLLLREYSSIFRSDPKATMSLEVLIPALTSAGGPGYLAAFLLAAAALCILLTIYTLGLNVLSYLHA